MHSRSSRVLLIVLGMLTSGVFMIDLAQTPPWEQAVLAEALSIRMIYLRHFSVVVACQEACTFNLEVGGMTSFNICGKPITLNTDGSNRDNVRSSTSKSNMAFPVFSDSLPFCSSCYHS